MPLENKMHITIMTQGLDGAIPFYRLKQPLEWCAQKGLLTYTILDLKKNPQNVYELLMKSDVCIWQAQTGWNAHKWIKTFNECNEIDGTNRISVFEYDDNLFDISPYNLKYNVFGTKEYWFEITELDLPKYKKLADEDKQKIYGLHESGKDKNGNKLYKFKPWTNGHDGFNLEENIDRIQGTAAIIHDCDLITVTTKELGKLLAKHTGRKKPIAILPNLIDFRLWREQKPNDTGKLRICWAGGNSHYHDWKVIEEALIEFQKEQDFTLVIAGQKFQGIHGKFKDVEYMEWHSDIRSYPMHMRDLKADFGVIPLQGNDFDKGKSPIKWEEYSALKIPTIASNVTPYKEAIKQNKTGFLVANTTSAWLEAFRQFSKDKDLRMRLANKANEYVKANFSIERSIEWYEAYSALKPSCKPKSKIVVAHK